MQSRLARWLSRASVSLALALAPSGAAWATLTIIPQNFSQKADATSTTVFYASTKSDGTHTVFDTGVADAPFHDPDPNFAYGVVDISVGSATPGSSIFQALAFQVSSTVTMAPPNAEEKAALVVRVSGGSTSGSEVPYAPIAANSAEPCSSLNTQICPKPSDAANDSTTFFYSAPFNAAGTTINIFPKDVCADYATIGSNASGCDTTTPALVKPADPAGGITSTVMSFTFRVVYLHKVTGVVSNPNVDSGELKLAFQSSPQPWTCPADLATRYFPGDGEVEFNTIGMAGNTTGFAPHQGLVALGKLFADPATVAVPVRDSTFIDANDFVSRVTFGDKEKVGSAKTGKGPMLNTTDGTDNRYTVAFMMRDAMGIINPVSSAGTACTVQPIQSASIQTFLNQSKCFIATAAFRSVDAAPVEMLRQFRDNVLLPTQWGSAFVDWYYEWSPLAAEWLMEHPNARFPVLQALVPVEVTAWFMLHPVPLTLLVVFTISGLVLGSLFWLVLRTKLRNKESVSE